MGSNMAENHPVGFQWVMEAKARGAKVLHVDPRFTRTSAMADRYVPLRAGSDIAFLGGVINFILTHERDFREYVVPYTNAATIVSEDFRDTEDLDGIFSGFDPELRSYETSTWQYAGMEVTPSGGRRDQGGAIGEAAHGAHGAGLEHAEPPERDETLQHPRCVYQLLKRHYARYTPELVEQTCGVDRAAFLEVCETLCANSGRERTTAFCYAVGWTQHTVGAQYIRAAGVIQLLLGNIGRPGGGILALRGHASIQGSTDIPTLYNILPGYLPMPHADNHRSLDEYVEKNSPRAGFWSNTRAYMVSLLKAWWGDAATAERDFCFDHLPRLTGDHSLYPTLHGMIDGDVKGFFVMGENPTIGAANGKLNRRALASLDWLVVRDLVEIETAAFWYDSPEIETGELRTEDIQTEVFFMPGASHVEKKGTFTNTQRLLQWREQAVEPEGDCRSELWFMYHLGRRVRERLAGSTLPRDRAVLDLTWDYPTEGPHDDPDAEAVLREIGGVDLTKDAAMPDYLGLKADGSTACGCWIYAGCYADEVNQPARRKPRTEQDWVAPEWAWAWPMNRRIIYNRASADPQGRPWSERKRYIVWDEEQRKWTGPDIPDFTPDKPPDYEPPPDARGPAALSGSEPFVMQADGKGWLFAPSGLTDGPMPTHYEPRESPTGNPLYERYQSNPTSEEFHLPENPYNPTHGEPGADVYPYAFTTYRLTEHHTAGGMSRFLPYLSELQPEMFCEVSPELAAERGLRHGDWMTVITSRTAIEARVMVTDRMRPLQIGSDPPRTVHQVGVPYHWGSRGLSTGDPGNDLVGLTLDSNTHIGEYKAQTCDVRPGRRPRGPALLELMESYHARTREANR
ncbi:MAG: Formate dehydrogenase [Solirubrobacterales bacterium]|jgi:formate dehydrogenase major subunit|nr:Formate dehydrogenase [Solirubrobacterales bacterium]